MKISWRVEAIHWVILAAMFVTAAVCWSRLPDQVPVHWNLSGEVDRTGSKFEGLLMPPLMTAGLYLLLLFIPRIDPGWTNYARFWGAYGVLRLAATAFMALMFTCLVITSFGNRIPITQIVFVGVGLMLMVIGNYMGKIRPNWFVGVRTPWTLSSKESWTKTHRLAGRLFMLAGLLFVANGMVNAKWLFFTTMGTLIASCAWMVVYSYLVWRGDPQRIPPAGTSPEG